MPYIGNTPALDYISFAVQNFTVTAGTTVYTLDYSVSNENDIALYINSVAQRPGSSFAYSATGTTLTLTSATLATDTMYAVFIGRAVQTVTPAAGSVTNTMLSPSVITGQTAVTVPATDDVLLCYDTSATALRKITFANFGNAPAFCAYAGSDQNIGDNTQTLLAFDTEVFDVGSCYTNTASNYKFTPNVAGKYLFNINATFRESAEDFSRIDQAVLNLYKNGSSIFRVYFDFQSNPVRYCTLSLNYIIDANGTTDYFQAYGQVNVNSANQGTLVGGATNSFSNFNATRLIGV